MTDRVHSLTVVLREDVRIDDIEPLVKAISLLQGVISVATNVTDSSEYVAQARARSELRIKLRELLKE